MTVTATTNAAIVLSNGVAMLDRLEPAAVPCGTCTLCCRGNNLVLILPEEGDDPAAFETQDVMGMPALRHKPNGDCIYLGEQGCTIHGRAPHMCRIFDCRGQHAMYTREQRRDMVKRGLLDKDVLKRGEFLRRSTP